MMPRPVVVRFTHACLQVLAERNAIDLLHIKGPAVDDTLLQVGPTDDSPSAGIAAPVPRSSVDADVLVRPCHVDRLLEVMHRHGWTTAYRFEDGSAFEHASTLVHSFLAPVDVHRQFPGIDLAPAAAFERLWIDRHTVPIAGIACTVPAVTAQRLVLVLHAARGGAMGHPDIDRCWAQATDEQQRAVQELAEGLAAEVALGAGTGRIQDHQGARSYELWRMLSTGEWSFPEVWAARVKAAPTKRAAMRTAVRLLVPNPQRMETTLGRPPTVRELSRAYVDRARWGAREVGRLVMAKIARSGGGSD